ncbi:hypothetical protein Tco_0932538, partial [Tanacetum coccineum]
LGWILEEIHVTWAHLEKKRTRLCLYTKCLKKLCIQSVDTASRVSSNCVRTFEVTASEICDIKGEEPPELKEPLGKPAPQNLDQHSQPKEKCRGSQACRKPPQPRQKSSQLKGDSLAHL